MEPVTVRAPIQRRDFVASMAMAALATHQRWRWAVRVLSALLFLGIAVALFPPQEAVTKGIWVQAALFVVVTLGWLFAPILALFGVVLPEESIRGRRFTFAEDGFEAVTPWQTYRLRWQAVRGVRVSMGRLYLVADTIVFSVPLRYLPSPDLVDTIRQAFVAATSNTPAQEEEFEAAPPSGAWCVATVRPNWSDITRLRMRISWSMWMVPAATMLCGVAIAVLPFKTRFGMPGPIVGAAAMLLAVSSAAHDILPLLLVSRDRVAQASARSGAMLACGPWGVMIKNSAADIITSWDAVPAVDETPEAFIIHGEPWHVLPKDSLGRQMHRFSQELQERLGDRFRMH